jgi:hypothetical protein
MRSPSNPIFQGFKGYGKLKIKGFGVVVSVKEGFVWQYPSRTSRN